MLRAIAAIFIYARMQARSTTAKRQLCALAAGIAHAREKAPT